MSRSKILCKKANLLNLIMPVTDTSTYIRRICRLLSKMWRISFVPIVISILLSVTSEWLDFPKMRRKNLTLRSLSLWKHWQSKRVEKISRDKKFKYEMPEQNGFSTQIDCNCLPLQTFKRTYWVLQKIADDETQPKEEDQQMTYLLLMS